jgi:tryptophanyl-tRNA synthetase
VFVQSQISAHSELCWILNNFVTMGELSRMTQFKDKSRKLGSEGQVVGLFDYPVLMAADILLYDANEIPVGDDQKQHVELVRDIAERFNTVYGDTFVLPEPTIQKVGARIMNLQDPSRKMSASDGELSSGIIWLSDDADLMRQKIMRAVTDSSNEVRAGQDKPALTNLLQIYSSITGKPIADIERQYHDEGYGKFKADLGDVVAEELAPLQKAFTSTRSDEAAVLRLLEEGRLKAEPIAMSKLAEVKSRVGLL